MAWPITCFTDATTLPVRLSHYGSPSATPAFPSRVCSTTAHTMVRIAWWYLILPAAHRFSAGFLSPAFHCPVHCPTLHTRPHLPLPIMPAHTIPLRILPSTTECLHTPSLPYLFRQLPPHSHTFAASLPVVPLHGLQPTFHYPVYLPATHCLAGPSDLPGYTAPPTTLLPPAAPSPSNRESGRMPNQEAGGGFMGPGVCF